MRKEFKYLISGLISGFVFCFCLFVLVITVSASEAGELSESEDHEIVQAEQTQLAESEPQATDQPGAAEEPPRSESIEDQELVQDEQSEAEPEVYDHGETMGFEAVEDDARIESFASGVIIGELADLLQDNVIENDGYTEESWQRYENAVAAGWDAISNFMVYTNDEVCAVIDELQAAILGLEYPAGQPTFPIGGTDIEIITVGLFSVVGSVAGSAFVNKWQFGV